MLFAVVYIHVLKFVKIHNHVTYAELFYTILKLIMKNLLNFFHIIILNIKSTGLVFLRRLYEKKVLVKACVKRGNNETMWMEFEKAFSFICFNPCFLSLLFFLIGFGRSVSIDRIVSKDLFQHSITLFRT